MFKDVTLLISEPCQSSNIDITQQHITEPQHSVNTIKVSNVDPGRLSQEMLTMYFENAKRSGGAQIKDFRLVPEKKKAFVTFKDQNGVY